MKEILKDKIIGTWKLISWTYLNKDNEVIDFFGENPIGILMYDASGYMNAQLMQSNRKAFTAPLRMEGTIQEMGDAYKSYAAYWGRYFERSAGELIHVVEGSLFPNWVGQEEIRYGKIEGEYLILSTPPVYINGNEIIFNVKWQRV